jgi:hypothetical protein
MIVRSMRNLAFVVSLAVALPAASADFDFGSYRPASLAEVALALSKEIDPRADYFFDAEHSKYSTVAIFTGRTRPVSSGLARFLEVWAKSFGHPDAYYKMFSTEIEIKQDSKTYWLPTQGQLLDPLVREVKPGHKVRLYVLLIGAYKHSPVFGVAEFAAIGAP